MSMKNRKYRNLTALVISCVLLGSGFCLLTANVEGAYESDDFVLCPGLGRTVTLLMTLSEPGEGGGHGPVDYMAALLDNSVNWAGKGVPDPMVLVIRDDNHSGEWTWDTDNIYNTLLGMGYDTTLVNEPGSGVPYEALEGYDVVLLSNPGYHLDDLLTAASLHQFYDNGGGVILQGDDISWSTNSAIQVILESLTLLDFVESGTSYYGHYTDNMLGDFYAVEIIDSHPVTAGLEGVTFTYGDDIDTTIPLPGAAVPAWATIPDDPPLPQKPVIAASQAPATIDGLIICKEHFYEIGCIDNSGIAQSLDQKLNAAKAAIERDQAETATNILGAFVNELDAQSGKHVSPLCAYLLTEYAERLIETLN